jgi:ADP-heptose:LPS heptosyltransferase
MLKLLRRKVLVAGPWIGEFGWELMEWQGYVRWRRQFYKETYVITYSNREYLYEGCHVFEHDLKLKDSGFDIGSRDRALVRSLVERCVRYHQIDSFDLFTPEQTLSRLKRRKQKFIKFYEPPMDERRFDILFHFRDFERADGDAKNLSRSCADEIVQWCLSQALSVACIGYPTLAYCPKGAVDRRTMKLREDVATICSATLVVGGSSGPMHLSSLCGTPILVWIGPPSDVERYISYWNPFQSKVYVLTDKTFNPPSDMIIRRIEELFCTDFARTRK